MAVAPLVSLQDLGPGYSKTIELGLQGVGFFDQVPSGSTVFLKPNLTFPVYRPGVMTSFECLESATILLRKRGYSVIIGEADSGGYNRFSMDEVFRQLKIDELATRTGSRVVNLSFTEPEWIEVRAGHRRVHVPIPRLLLREIGAFITLPVPKIHANTLVSLSIKNQWGCIQEPAVRLQLHPYFAEVMYELNRRLPHSYSVMDGRFGLNRSGPMQGDPVKLNWILISNDLVAADRVACRLMQIEENKVKYLNHFRSSGWWCDFSEIRIREDWASFRKVPFYLKRVWTDWPGLLCFQNSFLAWLGYRSPLAGLAHRLLYLFREPFYDYGKEKKKVRTANSTQFEG